MSGLAVYVRDGRDGAPRVVTVHGSMDRGASFLKLARELRGTDVVRYDRRGYGRSAEAGTCADLTEQVDDLLAVMDERPAVVVGHSFGGVIALGLAARRPDLVTGLLAFEPPMPWAPWWPETSAGGAVVAAAVRGGAGDAAELFMRRIVGDAVWERLPEATRRRRRAEGPALVAEIHAMREGPAPFVAEAIEVPAVLGHGGAAAARHRRAAKELAASIPGATLLVVPGAGHGAHSTHPGELAAAVRRLQSLS